MKCLGRTKASNFRKRCTRETPFLLCWQHAWQPLSVIVAIVLFFAALAEFTGFSLRDVFPKSPPVQEIIADPLPTGTFTLQDTPSFARRDNAYISGHRSAARVFRLNENVISFSYLQFFRIIYRRHNNIP